MTGIKKRELNLIPFGKGNQAAKGHGRPKNLDFVAAFREYAEQGKRPEQLFADLLKKKPFEAMHYLGGKPREMIVIDQTLKAEITTQEVVDAAKAIRAELDSPSQAQIASASTGPRAVARGNPLHGSQTW